MLNKRSGYDFDLERILRAAAQNRKVLEINAHPSRLDIDEQVARRAVSLGIKIAINSDAITSRKWTFCAMGFQCPPRLG